MALARQPPQAATVENSLSYFCPTQVHFVSIHLTVEAVISLIILNTLFVSICQVVEPQWFDFVAIFGMASVFAIGDAFWESGWLLIDAPAVAC